MLHGTTASGIGNLRNQARTEKILIFLLSSPSKSKVSILSSKCYICRILQGESLPVRNQLSIIGKFTP